MRLGSFTKWECPLRCRDLNESRHESCPSLIRSVSHQRIPSILRPSRTHCYRCLSPRTNLCRPLRLLGGKSARYDLYPFRLWWAWRGPYRPRLLWAHWPLLLQGSGWYPIRHGELNKLTPQDLGEQRGSLNMKRQHIWKVQNQNTIQTKKETFYRTSINITLTTTNLFSNNMWVSMKNKKAKECRYRFIWNLIQKNWLCLRIMDHHPCLHDSSFFLVSHSSATNCWFHGWRNSASTFVH